MRTLLLTVALGMEACTGDATTSGADTLPVEDSEAPEESDHSDPPADDTELRESDSPTGMADSDDPADTIVIDPFVPACTIATGIIEVSTIAGKSVPHYWSIFGPVADRNGDGFEEVSYANWDNEINRRYYIVDFQMLNGPATPGNAFLSSSWRNTGRSDAVNGWYVQQSLGDWDGDGSRDLFTNSLDTEDVALRPDRSFSIFVQSGLSSGEISILEQDYIIHFPVASYGDVPWGWQGAADLNADNQPDLVVYDQNANSFLPINVPGHVAIQFGPFPPGESEAGDPEVVITALPPSGLGRDGRYADVDQDGDIDLILADRHATGGGAVYVFLGPLTHDLDVSQADATFQPGAAPGWYANFGEQIDIGDANGDGFVDLLVGGPWWSWPAWAGGSAWLFHGPLVTSRDAHDADFSVLGDHALAQVGGDVDFVGDVDGDGRDDFLVGARGWTPNPVVTSPCDSADPFGCTPETEEGNGAVLLFVESPLGRHTVRDAALILTDDRPGDYFGQYNMALGDQTGDGLDDFYLADSADELGYLISPCELAP